jgi:hypothetical protein
VRGRHPRRALTPLIAALAVLALPVLPASATFHEILVREVYAGGASSDSYVVLQAYRGGQDQVKDHSLTAYAPGGGEIATFKFPNSVANGQNQMTILIADTAYAGTFSTGPAPDGTEEGLNLERSGGAVCWAELDCVSWGSFSGTPPLPSPAGPPAVAIPEEMALRRTIASGCSTLLEGSDDHNDSAADFAPVFPAPRSNAVVPSERSCGSGPTDGNPASPDSPGAPQTSLRRKPPKRSTDRTPTFRFASDEAGSTFQCKLDRKAFRSCRSPFTLGRLSLGRHTFRVRARDSAGHLDPSPALYAFTVTEKRR